MKKKKLKDGTPEMNLYIPKIKEGFIKTMKEKYDVCKAEAEELIVNFIKVIEDASNYLFSLNHSQAYSYIGFACAYLRHYHPLEFLTVSLNINKDDIEQTAKTIEYAKLRNIEVLMPKFRYSKGEYMCDKKQNAIYKGIGSIKFLNESCANALYELRNNTYENFISLLIDIKINVPINAKQLKILIMLDYFEEFGKSKKLLKTYLLFSELMCKKQISKSKIDDLSKFGATLNLLKKYSDKETEKMFKDINTREMAEEIYNNTENKSISMKDKLRAELEFLGYPVTILNNTSDNIYFVMDIEEYKGKRGNTYYPTLYRMKDGTTKKFKITDFEQYIDNSFDKFGILRIREEHKEPKRKLVDGKWTKSETEFNYLIDSWEVF